MSKTAQPSPIWLVLPQALLPHAWWQDENVHIQLQQHTQYWPKALLQCLATCPVTQAVAYGTQEDGQTHWAEGLMWHWLMGQLHKPPLTVPKTVPDHAISAGTPPAWAMLSPPHKPQAPVQANTRFVASAIHMQLHPQGCDMHHARLGHHSTNPDTANQQAQYWACMAPVLQVHGFRIVKQSGWDALVVSLTPMDLNTCSPWSAPYTNIIDILCNREQPSQWRTLWMEAQMALHTHNTRQAQVKTMDLPNGIWLWGNGQACTAQWLPPQLKTVHNNTQALKYWHDLCHNLLFAHHDAETTQHDVSTHNISEAEQPQAHGVWHCVDDIHDPNIWNNLNEQIIKPMQHSGIALGWMLCGDFGFKCLQAGFWHKLSRMWQHNPRWQHLQDAPQDLE